MPRKKETIAELLKNKVRHPNLNWSDFNFLENLLCFCVQPVLSAPKESGVSFRITVSEVSPSLCLLFQIDRRDDPLVRDPRRPRPDFLAFYFARGNCILTIIEMKGRDRGRAVEQISAFKDDLQREIRGNLPGKFAARVRFQGIILTSPQEQLPRKAIEREERRGLIILPLQYTQRAELFPYVSRLNRLSEGGKALRYQHKSVRQGRLPSPLEAILMHGPLHKRIQDELVAQHFDSAPGRLGVYLNYADASSSSYCALVVNTMYAIIACSAEHRDYVRLIGSELQRIGANSGFTFQTA
jgi:hypothetical protein